MEFISSYQYKFTNKTNIIARTYITNYETKTDLKELESKSDYYNDEFSQRFIRPELQSTCNFSKHQNWTVGVGIVKNLFEQIGMEIRIKESNKLIMDFAI